MTTPDVTAEALAGVTSPYQVDSPMLGPSKIRCYLDCPARYRMQYILRLPFLTSPAAALGTTIHTVIKQAHASRWSHKQAPLAARLLTDAWGEVRQATSDPDDPQVNANAVKAAQEWLPWYLSWIERQIEVVTEYRWTQALPGTDIKLTGTIDRVYRAEGLLVVSDVKSGARKPTPAEFAADVQGSLYSWAARQEGLREDRFETVWLRTQDVMMTTRTDAYLEAVLRSVVVPVVRGIEAEIFPCNPGPKWSCARCEFCDRCEIGAGGELEAAA